MPENSLVTYVMGGMKGIWKKPVKHADGYTAGISDISAWLSPIGNIWLELKDLREWPKRADTAAVFDYDDLQKEFTKARRGHVLCRVGREYLLFNHMVAYEILETERATQGTLHAVATKVWFGSINWKEFQRCLAKRYA